MFFTINRTCTKSLWFYLHTYLFALINIAMIFLQQEIWLIISVFSTHKQDFIFDPKQCRGLIMYMSFAQFLQWEEYEIAYIMIKIQPFLYNIYNFLYKIYHFYAIYIR